MCFLYILGVVILCTLIVCGLSEAIYRFDKWSDELTDRPTFTEYIESHEDLYNIGYDVKESKSIINKLKKWLE